MKSKWAVMKKDCKWLKNNTIVKVNNYHWQDRWRVGDDASGYIAMNQIEMDVYLTIIPDSKLLQLVMEE